MPVLHCRQRLLREVSTYARHGAHTRSFSSSVICLSGHSRWSKIKHDKGKVDGRKSKERSLIVKELATASKYGGRDPNLNPRLSLLVSNAKKMGFPKASIEAAIARGQGVSPSGAALEQLTIDFMVPDINVAGLIECETDSKARTMQHVRDTLKHFGGTTTAAAYMFDRRGKIVFSKEDGGKWDEEHVLDKAIESGAEDVIVEDEDAVIFTGPNEIAAVAESLSAHLGLKPESQELIWEPKKDMGVSLAAEATVLLQKILDGLQDDSTVQEVYLNTV